MILSILDINDLKKQVIKYFGYSIFFLIFGLIYECFSHGVYSSYMMYAFLIPAILGCLVYGILYFLNLKTVPNYYASKIYNSAILTFTLGSIMKGVLEIFGTTNNIIDVYFNLGIILILLSIIINSIYTINKYNK